VHAYIALKHVRGKHSVLSEEKLDILFQYSRKMLGYCKAWFPWRHTRQGGFRSKLYCFDNNIGLCRRWTTVNLWCAQRCAHFLNVRRES